VSENFQDPPPELLSRAEPLPVTLSNELRGLQAKTDSAGAETTFKVGKLLQRLFSSTDGRSFLSYVDARIDVTWSPPSWGTRYTLVLALQVEGQYHLIQSTGTSESLEGPTISGRQAIEGCIAETYEQVAALLGRSSRRSDAQR